MSAPEFDGINALVRAIAKALVLSEAEVVAAFDANQVVVQFATGDDGSRLIEVAIDERRARIGAGPSGRP
jgi:hypothetical protein